MLNSSREAQLRAAELLDRGGGRADAAERLEEHPQSLLHLLIRIENHPIGAVIGEPDRQPHAQLPSARLVHHPADEPRAQQVQLRLRHCDIAPFNPNTSLSFANRVS